MRFSRHGEHPGRFVGNQNPLVLIDHIDIIILWWQLKCIPFNIKPLQHELQQWQALATTCGIKMTMMTHLAQWRLSHPKLSHAQGMQPVIEGMI